MTTAKTHILRVKPPWREHGDRTRCGKRVEGQLAAIPADADMAARARPHWQWWVILRDNPARVPPTVRIEDRPPGICLVCWLNLGHYGYQRWQDSPADVLRVDLSVTDDQGRIMLTKELLALAELAARYSGELAEIMEGHAILAALARL